MSIEGAATGISSDWHSGPPSCFLSGELKKNLQRNKTDHIRGAPCPPVIQAKIERYHRPIKNVIKLRNLRYPWELEASIREFVEYCNKHRYHESLYDLTPEDVYFGRAEEVRTRREEIKRATLRYRKKWNLGGHEEWPRTISEEERIVPWLRVEYA